MEIITEVDGVTVPRVGSATLTVRMEIDGDAVISRTWVAAYAPAGRGDVIPLFAGDDEHAALMAFTGARLVLDSIERARGNRKADS